MLAKTAIFCSKRSLHVGRALASGTTSYPPPKPWHKIKEAEEGEIQEVDEFEGIKSDGRGAYINEEDQTRYLNEELKEWKIETIESYYKFGEPSYPDIPSLTPEQYTRDSKRTGLVAMKVGMINEWDPVWGEFHMCTVLQVEPTRVIQVKTKDTDGYDAIQLGTSVRKLKNFTKPELGHFKRWGNETPVRILKEFRVTPECLLPVGSHVGARHFIPGQHVDIQGTTLGKGFAGVMKRWGFGGQPASHGAGVHRHPGGMGGAQDPGRVFPGKKMGGHMGVDKRTVTNLKIYKIHPARGLIYVKGSVPGHKGNTVIIKDAGRLKYDRKEGKIKKYYPTFTKSDADREGLQGEEMYMPFDEVSPFAGEDDIMVE